MDQTRFMTVEAAALVNEALTLDPQLRAREGDSFKLDLEVLIPYEDETAEGKMSFLVERVTGEPAYIHPNGDPVYETWARIEPGGRAFKVTIQCPVDGEDMESAIVSVARSMEEIVNEFLDRQDRI